MLNPGEGYINMNYNKLNYFYTVAQTLNFTKAAEQLYVSQSAISRHMKELEEDFGTPLFIRTNRNLILTEAGKVLYNEISLFFSREEELYQKVRAASNVNVDKLNIGFMGIRPAYHIPSIVNDMLIQLPDLSVNLRRYNWDAIIPALNFNKIDVGLRLRMEEDADKHITHFFLGIDYPAMVVSNRHPLAEKKHASIRDFKNDMFFLLSEKDSVIPYSYTWKMLREAGLSSITYTEYDEAETILMMIHADAGVSVLSRFAATDQFPDLKIIELDGVDPIYCELVWRSENDNPMIPIFAERLKKDYIEREEKESGQ